MAVKNHGTNGASGDPQRILGESDAYRRAYPHLHAWHRGWVGRVRGMRRPDLALGSESLAKSQCCCITKDTVDTLALYFKITDGHSAVIVRLRCRKKSFTKPNHSTLGRLLEDI